MKTLFSYLFIRQTAINRFHGMYHGYQKIKLYRWQKLPPHYAWFKKK